MRGDLAYYIAHNVYIEAKATLIMLAICWTVQQWQQGGLRCASLALSRFHNEAKVNCVLSKNNAV